MGLHRSSSVATNTESQCSYRKPLFPIFKAQVFLRSRVKVVVIKNQKKSFRERTASVRSPGLFIFNSSARVKAYHARHGLGSQGTALHPSRVKGAVAARLISSLIIIARTEVKCPDSLEAMRIHLGFLVAGLGVVRAVGCKKTDDVVEVGLWSVSILSAI